MAGEDDPALLFDLDPDLAQELIQQAASSLILTDEGVEFAVDDESAPEYLERALRLATPRAVRLLRFFLHRFSNTI